MCIFIWGLCWNTHCQNAFIYCHQGIGVCLNFQTPKESVLLVPMKILGSLLEFSRRFPQNVWFINWNANILISHPIRDRCNALWCMWTDASETCKSSAKKKSILNSYIFRIFKIISSLTKLVLGITHSLFSQTLCTHCISPARHEVTSCIF
jgi:hypothetical protein